MDEEIRVNAFEGEPMRTWVVDGFACATYVNRSFGILNGYIRLPETHPDLLIAQDAELRGERGRFGLFVPGYDFVDVPVNGGWTYGPDMDNWIGFDTLHSWDVWPPDVRRSLVAPEDREELEMILAFEAQLNGARYRRPHHRLRSIASVEDEVSTVATLLAARLREAGVEAETKTR